MVVQPVSNVVLEMYNTLLADGAFSKEWNISRLGLVCKPDKTGYKPTDFRPICLIDVAGKLYG